MILPCGCDSIFTDFFDRCAPCRERISIEADALIRRDRLRHYSSEAYDRDEGWIYAGFAQHPERRAPTDKDDQ